MDFSLDISLTIFLVLVATTTVAAGVNGALGYGFSAIVVPVSLTMVTGRLLNPALVSVHLWAAVKARRLAARPVRLSTAPLEAA